MKYEEKVPGGKLVCIEVWPDGGRSGAVRITGDFFLHPEESISRLEDSLRGLRLDLDESQIKSRLDLALGDSQLIGVSTADLARMFRRAVS